MSAVAMPSVENLPIHADKLPSSTSGIVDELAKIMRIDLHHATKKDDYTMRVLTGVVMYRHLEKHQQMKVIEMIRNEEHIAHADWWELTSRCTDVLLQPRWWLWSLTTEELESIIKDQERTAAIFSFLGYGASVSSVGDFVQSVRKNLKEGKSPFKGQSKNIAIFLVATSWSYLNAKQLSNSKEEMDRRTGNPKSSSYYK